MPRPLRLQIANGVYHITNRGVERRNIVQDDHDRQNWLRLLARVAERCRWRVFAYALLNNHFHLFLRTPEPNLSQGMQVFESGYVTRFNRRHDRVGPLFQSRFHDVLVESEGHGWELSRYIHLNSVRAKLADHPDRYVWSSFPDFMDPRRAPLWLDWRTILAEMGGQESTARMAYRRFVEAGIARPPANPLASATDDGILGSERFVNEVRALTATQSVAPQGQPLTLDRIEAVVARLFAVDPELIRKAGRRRNRARDAAILLARDLSGESLQSLAARWGGVGPSAICESARRAGAWHERDHEFRALLEHARSELRGQALQTSIFAGQTASPVLRLNSGED